MLENAVRSTIEREADAATVQAYEAAVPPSHLFMGLERYWRKRLTSASAKVR